MHVLHSSPDPEQSRWRAKRRRTGISLAAAAASAALVAGAADAGIGAPHGLSARSTGSGPAVPYLAWSPVGGSARYQVQVAADSGFKSLVSAGGDFTTSNTRATLTKTLPSHKYWWRVRAASKDGAVSGWSTGSFTIRWKTIVARSSSGNTLVLRWGAISGAAKYSVELSFDPSFATLVGGRPTVTSANAISPSNSLPENTYYWRVTPLDAEGNPGTVSPTWSFEWKGPSSSILEQPADTVTAANLTQDFPGSPDTLFVPRLSWKPVVGAARYEVEINSDSSWAAGSKVCCDGSTAALTLTPTRSLPSNRYYWRVRGLDGSGNAGPWFPRGSGSDANAFTKTFDNVCSDGLAENCIARSESSITGLHVNGVSTGGVTNSPLILWNPVPGASSYEYDVVPYAAGCQWTAPSSQHWSGNTATTGWTPLGDHMVSTKPYPDRSSVANDGSRALLANSQYCFRVRAQTDRDPHGAAVYGDFAYLPSADQPAFRFGTYAQPGTGAPAGIDRGSVKPLADGSDGRLRKMPIFTWSPVAGAASYWVIVARDPSFTNIVDYAFTRIPAYAPRTSSGVKSYADETTTFYWVALPSPSANGACLGAGCDPLQSAIFKFQKEVPPTSLQLANGSQPTFAWNPVPGARRYELQVSTDGNFGTSFVEKVTTVATSYTATTTYPPGKKLYWRVRADDETLTGLSWAEGPSFQTSLGAPRNLRTETARAGGTTTWRWDAVQGSVSYDIHVELPSGSTRDFQNVRVTEFNPGSLNGTGAFRWQVRARFSKGSGTVVGPYSTKASGIQKVWQPASMRTLVAGRALVLLWKPVLYAKNYRVQVSNRHDFSSSTESATTDNPGYAPKLGGGFDKGGRFYWRVAAVDASGNTGKFTTPAAFSLPGNGQQRATGLRVKKP
jgi:large repetitive protein